MEFNLFKDEVDGFEDFSLDESNFRMFGDQTFDAVLDDKAVSG